MYSWILRILVLVVCADAELVNTEKTGYCRDKTTVNETIPVTYTETVPCRTGKCIVKKTKFETHTKEVFSDEICCPRYGPDDDEIYCVPICEHGCEKGLCVAPDVCECKPPLVFHNSTAPYFCGPPICDQPCINGNCTANNQCTCNDGFIPKDSNTCVPHCTQCENGVCISPGVCNCHEGYTKIDGKCTPQCKSGCNNGYCSAPDTCTCKDGYEKQAGKCQPVCKKPCLNGDCIAPGTCECKEGFVPKNGHKESCIPKCNDGYELKDDKCQPICKKACKHGSCVAPNTCGCNDGYELKGKDTCVPKCNTDCSNGFCSEPNICGCNSGYLLKNNTCEPVCDKKCINGNCVEPNKCTCIKGYEKDKSIDTCIPKCDSCTNGHCIAPNKCECNEGYSLKDKICIPKCKQACVNGDCSAPDECSCKTGFMKDMSNSSLCYKPCGSCNLGTCKDGACVCEPDMDLINGTCVVSTPSSPEMSSRDTETTGLASVQMTWWVGGAVLLLLIVLVLVVISRLYARKLPQKAPDDGPYGSVAYTLPNTLFHKDDPIEEEEDTNDTLLEKGHNDELDNVV